MNYSPIDLKSYLIDCLGYSDDELDDQDLESYLSDEDWHEFVEWMH